MSVYLPRDSAAVSIGADEVAAAITAADPALSPLRTGARGLYALEPLVEVDHGDRRIGFGPVTAAAVPGLVEALRHPDTGHPLRIGDVDTLLADQGQNRFTCRRLGRVVPDDWDDFVAHGGTRGLRRALDMERQSIVDAVTASGLRGRGGAGFPTGRKWQTVLDADGPGKVIVCNADEGDSGTFADRMLMEGDPLALIEGMAIAGIAVGAVHGYIYLRCEYPAARASLLTALDIARHNGLLGADVLGAGHTFDIELRMGAGVYICGEETSLLESLEGHRGEVRFKPPLPAIRGFMGRPTVVNNVVTLATVPAILADGAEAYATLGHGKSRGTLTVQLCGNVRRPGLYEVPFGVSLADVIDELGGGTASGRAVRAVQAGGPLGAYLPASALDVPLDYEALAERGGMIGHGGIVVFDDTVDMAEQARFAMEFCAIESCGKCTPCRIGSVRAQEVIDRIVDGEARESNTALLRELCETMIQGSLCAHGGMAPHPVLSALNHFPDDFNRQAVGS
ncbi:NADH-ubiquinone oxidoreductase-F iron-sulfur binding region domain-containing protein [Arhodomonas aquaeolei]|uniref:NADH-ubiquinone oxidoreductase-F iron-sulfur binding region domain-containing protein n=1 Tax=Arhodomonas aquaeolei TaxID=2369 RepID=UPI0003823813|nr:NADH-ubiquinone oxidoreductase-F iron-sulfur binding region domain-containing protein [Arhodomonas aquaeolei]